MSITTRFAPSPTGHLHLGHAYSALFAARAMGDVNAPLILRLEDIDPGRYKKEYEEQIFDDLNWLGLRWHEPVRRQSRHMADYSAALDTLSDMGLLYPCFCSRAAIRREIAASSSAPHDILTGPDGPLYPRTCRGLSEAQCQDNQSAGQPFALRLDMQQAMTISGPLHWHDGDQGTLLATPEIFGDVIVARKETPTSYHIAVTLDDHFQNITLVTRGQDLFHASHVHRLLQCLLGLDVPDYHHHRLIEDDTGRRLAKRDNAATLMALRAGGTTAAQVRQLLGFEP
jgi:glutamyl-Q tRNA(Asp) synthetase